MNIVVLAWRHWSAGRRFRSLFLNAPKAGHTVYAIAGDHLGDMQMSLDILKGYNVTALPQRLSIEDLKPDVVFGEYYAPAVVMEHSAHEWANSKGIPSIILNHHVYHAGPVMPKPVHWKHPVLVTTNEAQRQAAVIQQEGFPLEQCVVLGSPDADTHLEPVDVAAVKSRLGIDKPVVGIFCHVADYPLLSDILKQGWWVGIHAHPQERRLSNTPKEWGFYFTGSRQRHLEAKGAHFLVDYLPGTIAGVKMELCTSYELLTMADVVLTTSSDVIVEGYLVGKKVHILTHPDTTLDAWASNSGLIDIDYELTTSNLDKVFQGLQESQTIQPDTEKWITYNDRNWWTRALELAENLCGKNGL